MMNRQPNLFSRSNSILPGDDPMALGTGQGGLQRPQMPKHTILQKILAIGLPALISGIKGEGAVMGGMAGLAGLNKGRNEQYDREMDQYNRDRLFDLNQTKANDLNLYRNENLGLKDRGLDLREQGLSQQNSLGQQRLGETQRHHQAGEKIRREGIDAGLKKDEDYQYRIIKHKIMTATDPSTITPDEIDLVKRYEAKTAPKKGSSSGGGASSGGDYPF
jgi:hypothetical protein